MLFVTVTAFRFILGIKTRQPLAMDNDAVLRRALRQTNSYPTFTNTTLLV